MRSGTRLVAGFVGAAFALAAAAAPADAEEEPACGQSVTIEAGDTLQRIADRCETSVAALVEANPQISDPNLISAGSTLVIPASEDGEGDSTAAENAAEAAYQVKTGDTLYSIAEDLGTSVQAVIEANPGVDPGNMPIGRIIKAPGATRMNIRRGDPAGAD